MSAENIPAAADCPTCHGDLRTLVRHLRLKAEERSTASREGKWAAARSKLPQGEIPAGAAGSGQRILIARVLRKITQRKLAKQIGVSPQLIIWWETGKSYPDVAKVERLAAVFDIRPAVLMKWPCPLCE